ncbi:MAG: polysaccharide biosynthesis C-terminal domain-containing protein [Clostridia bacterium]|nr:polysaccharide biosynthesis C-terminal domain-containing protein [Clostridia bacterium]
MARIDRYKKLFSNTLILGLGTLASKVLTVLLMPLYTSYLTNGEYGIVDLVVQAANLLIPLVSLGMNTAVLRFNMDGETDRSSVLTAGLTVNLLGFGAFALFFPLVRMIPTFGEHAIWVYIFVFCSIMHYLFAYFVKSLQKVKLFAGVSIIGTAITLLLDVLFLAVWHMGVVGYILAIVLSDFICTIILFFSAKLYRFINIKKLNKAVTSAMLRYSIPLIPTSALWWVTDMSDRYMVTWYINEAANGLYAISYKIPNLLILVCGIFMDAWQMSILTESSRLERKKFFSHVFSMYQAVIFVGASLLILCAKLVTRILVADSFYPSWEYMPTLIIATALSCFVTFLGTIYIVEKRSKSSLFTTVIGTVGNLIGNFIFIPRLGVHGAALSTAASYGLVFLLRAVHTRRFIPIDWNVPRFVANSVLLIVQAIIMVLEVRGWVYIEGGIFLILLIMNFKPLLGSIRQVISRRSGG